MRILTQSTRSQRAARALAAKLIREGTPPTEVALRVGYENYSNFYRMYQRHLHAAPLGAYRRTALLTPMI